MPVNQTKTDGKSTVDAVHGFGSNFAHSFPETFFVNGTYLFKQDGGIFLKPTALGGKFDMSGQFCFIPLAGDGSCNNGRAVPVTDVILDDENRPDTALFRADDRGKIRVINFTRLTGELE